MLKTHKRNEGFTIIEVLIVLAIAGLILLVVFLAVPNLQRSQRNNGRASEASRFASSVANFVSNNQGSVPSKQADVASIVNDFGTFKYLQASGGGQLTVPGTLATKMVGGQVNLTAGAIATGTAVPTSGAGSGDAVLIDTGAVCGSPSTTMTTTAGTSRQIAVIYTQESTGASYNQVCVQAE